LGVNGTSELFPSTELRQKFKYVVVSNLALLARQAK
jgi:hypothetical protein